MTRNLKQRYVALVRAYELARTAAERACYGHKLVEVRRELMAQGCSRYAIDQLTDQGEQLARLALRNARK